MSDTTNAPRGVRLEHVVPWGRRYAEYAAMFDLTDADLRGRRVLGCGDGPASFNAEATALGYDVVSCDPIYAFTAADIRRRVDETYGPMMAQVREQAGHFVWGDAVRSPEHLGELRMGAMERFLADLPAGTRAGRYAAASLPNLPFADNAFDLAVCSHLLFLYSEQLSGAFHAAAVRELCRVAREVRVFPLLDLAGERSRHLEAVRDALPPGLTWELRRVGYEFLRGANETLIIRRAGR